MIMMTVSTKSCRSKLGPEKQRVPQSRESRLAPSRASKGGTPGVDSEGICSAAFQRKLASLRPGVAIDRRRAKAWRAGNRRCAGAADERATGVAVAFCCLGQWN